MITFVHGDRRIKHKAGVERPIGMGMSSSAAFVDWFSRGAFDILVSVNPWYVSGGCYLYLQDTSRGRQSDCDLHYLEPVLLPGLNGHYIQPLNYGDGDIFDLFGYAPRNPGPRSQQRGRGIGWLKRYRNIGTEGAPRFGVNPDDVEAGGGSLEVAVEHSPVTSITLEYDIYGRTCAAIVSSSRDPMAYWPDRVAAWDADSTTLLIEERPGGTGYDPDGVWRGSESLRIAHRFPFHSDRQKPKFGRGRELYSINSLSSISAAGWWDRERRHRFAIAKDVDQLILSCAENRENSKRYCTKDNFFQFHISTFSDSEKFGNSLLVTGNTGYINLINKRDPSIQSRLMGTGGAVRVGTLAIPSACVVEGSARIYVGDACGSIYLIEYDMDGTAGALIPVLADGQAIKHQAGPFGSLQGPAERRWGYINPLIIPNPNGGEPELLTVDITGRVMLYQPMAGSRGTRFHAPKSVVLDGLPMVASWRSRPALWADDEFLFHTTEGLQLFRRHAGNRAVFSRGRNVRFVDGSPIGAGRLNGLAGRVVLEKIAWRSNLRADLLIGLDGRISKDYSDEYSKESLVLSLRCVEDRNDLIFDHGEVVKLKNGCPLVFGEHNCGVTAIAMPNGNREIIVGAEDGHIYRFLDTEIAGPWNQ